MDEERLLKLIDQVLSGDRDAAALIFHEFQPKVFRLAMRYSRGNKEEAKDITQEAFMQAFKNMATLQKKHRFSSWLMQITANAALQRLRAKSREGRFLGRWAEEQAVPGSVDDPLLRELKIGVVSEMISALPDDGSARIVKLFYGPQDLSTQEISDRLTVPKGTVTVTLKRFRDRIRERLVLKLLELDEAAEVRS